MNRLLASWRRVADKPLGPWLFSRRLGAMVPYSGTIGARVVALEPRRSELRLPDRRRIRNHLDSIHAAALMNVGELASGLALLAALPDDRRAILVRFRTEFVKKARGALLVRGEVDAAADLAVDGELEVAATIEDAAQVVVARVQATWRIDKRA